MAMQSKTFSEYGRDGAGLMNELPGRQSRELVVLGPHAARFVGGTVLGRVSAGALSAIAAAAVSGSGGTPGNGVVNNLTVDNGAEEGNYEIVILNPATNGGAFEVRNPDGGVDGNGTVGQAYNGAINFTLADGSVDFSEDDRIRVTVSAAEGNGLFVPVNAAASNGGQIADAILIYGQNPSPSAPQPVAVIARGAEWAANFVTWPAGTTAEQQKVWEAQLAEKGILIRHPA
jgi:hypothetical protein